MSEDRSPVQTAPTEKSWAFALIVVLMNLLVQLYVTTTIPCPMVYSKHTELMGCCFYKKPTREHHIVYSQLNIFIPTIWDCSMVFGTEV